MREWIYQELVWLRLKIVNDLKDGLRALERISQLICEEGTRVQCQFWREDLARELEELAAELNMLRMVALQGELSLKEVKYGQDNVD
jgi:hypothetical protein